MDHPKDLTHISLCAGYGGIDLGLRRALGAVRTVAFVEIESFAVENLVAKIESGHLDPAPIWTNLKTFPWEQFRGRVDILSGGFPCQPFSAAGRREGDSDPRHLFPYITEGIRELGYPPIVFFENVEGIISSKLKGDGWADPAGTPVLLHVLRELERLGYEATAGVFSASEVGAPHQRKRVFIMGCRADLSSEGRGIVDRLLRGTERGSDVEHPHSKRAERADVARLCSLPTQTSQSGAERERRTVGQKAAQAERKDDGAKSHCSGSTAYPAPRGTGQDVAHTCDHSGRCSGASVHSDRRAVDGRGESVPSERDAQDSHAQHASDAWPAEELANTNDLRAEPSTIHRSTEAPESGGVLSEITDWSDNRGCTKAAYPAPRGAEQYLWEPPRVTVGNATGKGLEGSTGASVQGREPRSACASAGNAVHRDEGSRRGTRALPTESGDRETSEPTRTDHTPSERVQGQIEPTMGRDSDGVASGMGYAELCHAVDNRTDELRLLGNGVVPATAERAFRVLWADLRD